MAEILLIFPPDKTDSARQVEAALGSAGYRAVLEPVVEPDGEAIARKASGHSAALLIWSRALAASADLGGWLASLRRLPGLVEVSTDGIAPQSGDERRVVLLSGWRGQPFHLGWQRVLDELESLGARRSAPVRPGPPPPPITGDAPAANPPPADLRSTGRGRRLALPAAAALAVLAAAGGSAWLASDAPDPPAPSAARTVSAPEATERSPQEAAPAPRAAPSAMPGPAPAPLPSTQAPPVPIPAPQPAVRSPARAPSQDPPKSRPTAKPPRPSVKPSPAAAPPVKRYSRKNSRTMRQFCARSGRSTPQCRDFARSTRALRP